MRYRRVSIHTNLAWGAMLGALLWLSPPARSSTVWDVKADGSGDLPTIQAAIDAAVSGDTVLVYPGTYTELCRIDDKVLVLLGRDGAETTILDGQLSGRLLVVNSGEVMVEGFTIENGRKNGIEVDNQGAGVAGFKAFVHIRNCVFQGNIASLGGAVHVSSFSAPEGPSLLSTAQLGAGLLVENTVFLNNIATDAGGGLHADEVPSTLIDCTFQGNHAGQLGGGADFLHADQHLVRCRFEGNDAFNGAGVSWSGFGVLSLDQVVFQSNIADNQGGGLWSVNATQLMLDHTWFLENQAHRGGGIYLAQVLASGTRSLWRGNTASVRGGDAYFVEVTGGEFTYSTWMSGSSPDGAAIFADGGELHLTSCIVGEESANAVSCTAATTVSDSCTVGGLTTGNCLAFVARTTVAGCDATPEFLCSIPSPADCGAVGHAIAVCPEGTCPTPVRNVSWGTLKARYRP